MSKLKPQGEEIAKAPPGHVSALVNRAPTVAPAFAPTPLQRTVESAVALPRLPASTRFTAWVHPMAWMVTAEGDVVPDLRRCYRTPGIAGVLGEQVKDGAGREVVEIDMDQAELALTKKGWRPVPDELVFGSLCLPYQCTGGRHWLAAWEIPHPGTSKITVDRAKYRAYIEALIANGYVTAPREDVLIALRERTQAQHDQAQSRAERGRDKMRARAADAFLFRVEALQRVIDGGSLFFGEADDGPEA